MFFKRAKEHEVKRLGRCGGDYHRGVRSWGNVKNTIWKAQIISKCTNKANSKSLNISKDLPLLSLQLEVRDTADI